MKNWFYPLFFGVLITACKPKEQPKEEPTAVTPSSEIHLIPQFGSQSIAINEVFTSSQGYDVKLTNFQILGTDMAFGANIFTPAFLFNFPSGSTRMALLNTGYSSFDSIHFNIGVPASLNHADPTLPGVDSPLNIANVDGMYWGWNPGYIFVKIEGKIDTIADGIENFDKSFSYHLGDDTLFRTTSSYKLSWTEFSDSKFRANLYFDFSLFFDELNDPLNIKTDSYTHSSLAQDAFNQRLMSKVKRSIH